MKWVDRNSLHEDQQEVQSPAPHEEESHAVGDHHVEKHLCRTETGVLLDTKLNMSFQYALAAKKVNGSILDCIWQSVANMSRDSTVETTLGVLCPVLSSLVQGRFEHPGKSPAKGHEGDEDTGESLVRNG